MVYMNYCIAHRFKRSIYFGTLWFLTHILKNDKILYDKEASFKNSLDEVDTS